LTEGASAMKKPILSMIILLLLLMPAVSNASYLILLKNGGELVTPLYWVEGNQMFFFYGSGIAGIERIVVDRVEMSEKKPADYMDTISENRGNKELPPLSSITEKAQGPENFPEVKAGEKDSPEKLGENSAKKRLQEELRTLEAESASEWDKYLKTQEKLRILVFESDSEGGKYQKSSEQDSISKERGEARNRVFTIDLKKQELIGRLQGNNPKNSP